MGRYGSDPVSKVRGAGGSPPFKSKLPIVHTLRRIRGLKYAQYELSHSIPVVSQPYRM
jgi:hypothetical protein